MEAQSYHTQRDREDRDFEENRQETRLLIDTSLSSLRVRLWSNGTRRRGRTLISAFALICMSDLSEDVWKRLCNRSCVLLLNT